jgi:hypothetical protein
MNLVSAAKSAAAMGALASSALLGRVTDKRKVEQFVELLRSKLGVKNFRLLYTNSRNGGSNASFQQHCDNQV